MRASAVAAFVATTIRANWSAQMVVLVLVEALAHCTADDFRSVGYHVSGVRAGGSHGECAEIV